MSYLGICIGLIIYTILFTTLHLSFLPDTEGMNNASKPTHKKEGPARLVVALNVR